MPLSQPSRAVPRSASRASYSLMSGNFWQLLKASQKEYGSWKPIYSPALQQKVYFTMEGFRHLRSASPKRSRPLKESWLRLKLLKSVPSIIKTGIRIDAYRYTSPYTRNHSKDSLRTIEYWAIESRLDASKTRIRVILRRTYSPIPAAWRPDPADRRTVPHYHQLHLRG